MDTRPLIIGIGNPERGDDAAGPAVIAGLDQHRPQGFDTALCGDDLTCLMDLWWDRVQVVLVDMVQIPQAEPGSVHRFDVSADALPYNLSYSSHTLSLSQCIELARTLQQLPQQIIIVGIAGIDARVGAPLSPAVAQAVSTVAAELGRELGGKAGEHHA